MYPNISYKEFLNLQDKDTYLLIDVRTPLEFESECIPGAVNIPIFSNEERAAIGTAYTRESIDKAKKLGIAAISLKLPEIFSKIVELNNEYKHLIFYCARGGFRSTSISSLLQSLKINAMKLEGGYKAYRAYILETLPKLIEKKQFVVLYGNTGTGKTHVLDEMKKLGAGVVDLEACANHRGSTLGSVGLGNPNSQKMFESLLFEELNSVNGDIIYTEGESKRIGRSVIPDYFFNSMLQGTHVELTAPIDVRVSNIVDDYVIRADNEIIEALNVLRKRLGNTLTDSYIQKVKDNDYEAVARELMINYYDPMYEHHKKNYCLHLNNIDPKITARKILEKFG